MKKLKTYFLETNNGWIKDTEKITENLKSEIIFFWIEDHLCIKESNIINYTNQRALEREDISARFQFDIQKQEMQRDQNVSMVRQQVDMSIQQENFNLEREEMNWDLRRQQIQLDYENQLRDFQNQIEQVKFQAEVDKDRLSMDKEQFEAEMMQLENEIQSRIIINRKYQM